MRQISGHLNLGGGRWQRRCGRGEGTVVWREAVKRFTRSGLSVRALRRHENLAEVAFYLWCREIGRREDELQQAACQVAIQSAPNRRGSHHDRCHAGRGRRSSCRFA